MDTDSCIVYIKTEDIYLYISKDVETRFHALKYELDRPLPTGKHKKAIELIKCQLGKKQKLNKLLTE